MRISDWSSDVCSSDLPSRWLYDDEGSELFERITALDESYPTRTETALLREHAADMANFCGRGSTLLVYGAGPGLKTEILLAALHTPRDHVSLALAGDSLALTVPRMLARLPELEFSQVVAVLKKDFDLT